MTSRLLQEEPTPGVYTPALCLIAQGRKRVLLAGDVSPYDPAHFLLVALDLPIVAQVSEATPQTPYLRLRLRPALFGSAAALSNCWVYVVGPVLGAVMAARAIGSHPGRGGTRSGCAE